MSDPQRDAHGPELSGQNASNEDLGQEQMQAMAMLGGGSRPEGLPQADDADFSYVDEAGGSRINQSTILVIVVLVIAAGSLYAMRLTQGEITTEAGAKIEAKIEQTLIKLGNPATMSEDNPLRPENLQALFRDTDEIISTLKFDLSGRQVPSDQVRKNPFQLAIKKEAPVTPDTSGRQREAQLERLRAELSSLNLQSVMGAGGSAVAVIDGEFYQVGQSVGSFRITAIQGSGSIVELSALGEKFQLTMDG